jgi:hypothetical protein
MIGKSKTNLLFAPFFSGEGGYCNLLKVLLTGDITLARVFRRVFSEKVLEPKLQVQIGEAPLNVRSEVTVHHPEEVSQTIDLVMDLDNDIVGVEAKVFAASARKGQLHAQYRGLRTKNPNKHVHSLFISPSPTSRHKEVKAERDGDRAESITWDDVFACFPQVSPIEPNDLLGALIKQAVEQFEVIRKRLPKTVMTTKRLAVKEEMKNIIELFNNKLRDNGGKLRDYTWKPHFWRDPKVDVYYGPLTDPDGKPLKGQNLQLSAHYEEDDTSNFADNIRMNVAFRLERRGGVKTYRTEFEARRQSCMDQLPMLLPRSQRECDQGGNRVFDDVWITVRGDEIPEIAGRPVNTVLAELLFAYSVAFSDFLIRNSLPVRVKEEKRERS